MKRLLRIIRAVLIFGLLTVLTQVGGLLYLVYWPIGKYLTKDIGNWPKRTLCKSFLFGGFLMIVSLLILPPIAQLLGRVPLPLFSTDEFPAKPATLLTCLGNRHYVTPELKKTFQQISQKLRQSDPQITLIYLDANFPFGDGFPLLPHLSHDDGRKLDLGFIYRDTRTKQTLEKAPTLFGYGHCEKPTAGEANQPQSCEEQGFWQYSLISKITPQRRRFNFDLKANQMLLNTITNHRNIRRVFIEPHLKQRLGMSSNAKVRFHGCWAVRHDDHIHMEL